MATHTYSGLITSNIVLGSFNPVYVTGTVNVPSGLAISGQYTQAFTIGNSGTIASPTANGGDPFFNIGIVLEDGGGGTVNNRTAKSLIVGYSVGVLLYGGAGKETVTNSGTIEGTSAYYDAIGVECGNIGVVVNGSAAAPKALIYGAGAAIEATGGSINNSGTIDGGYDGIFAFGYSASYAETVINKGLVAGRSGDGIYLTSGGTVTNGAAGIDNAVIIGYQSGIKSYLAGTVINDGTVEATAQSGAAGNGISLGIYGGIVTNGGPRVPSALISGYGAGILASGLTVVSNDGTIAASGASGVGVNLTEGGSVTNGAATAPTALVSGYYAGIYIAGASGNVVNDGTITGLTGVTLGDGGEVRNGNLQTPGALIYGDNNGIVFGATAAGAVINDGTIAGGQAIVLNDGGSVTNGASNVPAALIAGYLAGVSIGGATGSITNDGTIASIGIGFGVAISDGGKVTNGGAGVRSALISGSYDGIAGFGGVAITVINDGTVAGPGNTRGIGGINGGVGVYLPSGSTVTNGAAALPDALISGYFDGVKGLGAAVTVVNDGTIAANGAGSTGIYLAEGGTITNGTTAVATAAIGGYDTGVEGAGGTAVVTNHATIAGQGAYGVGVSFTTAAASTLTNAGTIVGAGGTAVSFNGAVDLLVVDAGAVFGGLVEGGGTSEAKFAAPGTANIGNFQGFSLFTLANGGANRLTLTSANFVEVSVITVDGGNSGNTINVASGLPAGDRVVINGGSGTDVLTGGAENDTFNLSAATLATATVTGGGGSDLLSVTTAGAIDFAGVEGVKTIKLSSAGANTLTLQNSNFTGAAGAAITVDGGTAGNTLSEAGVTASDSAELVGGTAADTLIAGLHATLTGGAGADVFEFTTPGSTGTPDQNTITDFVHGTDRIAFSDVGFDLGLSGATSIPQALPSTLFSTETNGTFNTGNDTERFAYNTTNGQLIYGADGAGSGSTLVVATLTGHPSVTAGDLYFVT